MLKQPTSEKAKDGRRQAYNCVKSSAQFDSFLPSLNRALNSDLIKHGFEA